MTSSYSLVGVMTDPGSLLELAAMQWPTDCEGFARRPYELGLPSEGAEGHWLVAWFFRASATTGWEGEYEPWDCWRSTEFTCEDDIRQVKVEHGVHGELAPPVIWEARGEIVEHTQDETRAWVEFEGGRVDFVVEHCGVCDSSSSGCSYTGCF